MTCFAKPGLTRGLVCSAKGRMFNNVLLCAIRTLDKGKASIDKLILSSERMLHKDYGRDDSVEKKKAMVV
jgi:hypothetical protein